MNFGSVMSVPSVGLDGTGFSDPRSVTRGVANIISNEMDKYKQKGFEYSGYIIRTSFRDFIRENRGKDKKIAELVTAMTESITSTDVLIRKKIGVSKTSEIIPYAQKIITAELKNLFEKLIKTNSYQRAIRESSVRNVSQKLQSRLKHESSQNKLNPSVRQTLSNEGTKSQYCERSVTETGYTNVPPSKCTSLETSSISNVSPVQCTQGVRAPVIKEERRKAKIDMDRGPCGMFSEGFSREAAMSSGEKCCHDFLVRGMQSYYYGKMYPRLASIMSSKTDKQVYESCVNNSFLKLDNFEISIPDANKIERTSYFLNAVETLKQLHSRISPIEKIACMFQFGEYLKNAFLQCWGDTDYDLCADIFVPIVIIAVIRTRPTNLFSDVEFVRKFGTQDMLRDQWGYYLTNLESAAYFIEKLSVEGYDALKIDKKEYLSKKTRIFVDDDDVKENEDGESREDDTYDGVGVLSRSEPEYTNLKLALLKIFSLEISPDENSEFGISEIKDLDSLTVSELKNVCKKYSRMVDVIMSAKMYLDGNIDTFK